MTEQCQWCGRFIAASTPTLVRTVHDVAGGRTFRQRLCPECRDSAMRWSINVTFELVDD
jgi:ribosomal protein L37AE/L43A